MEYLLFRLYGPLASWGEIAVGESRHTASYPGKSALLGLLAAALGIRRDEEGRQLALASGYYFAVKVLSTGSLLRDYHTAQAPDAVGSSTYRTRRDEIVIGKERLGTILSSREYRCDALSIVAVRALDNAPYSLDELRESLLKPRFHLYLGRKSCPLATPLKPQVLPADGLGDAFNKYQIGPLFISSRLMQTALNETKNKRLADAPSLADLSRDDLHWLSIGKESARYYWEGDAGDLAPQQMLIRHDQPTSRGRWQFTQRAENFLMTKGVD